VKVTSKNLQNNTSFRENSLNLSYSNSNQAEELESIVRGTEGLNWVYGHGLDEYHDVYTVSFPPETESDLLRANRKLVTIINFFNVLDPKAR